ncbi:NADH-quinone oxidoreductase subunit L [Candidatus Bathyarchaeota archaeon]|nr:NADH-quinone oxidoreductase subunit L [Candidatus Bathyarchaeota archaeon]
MAHEVIAGWAAVTEYWPAFMCWFVPMLGAALMPLFDKLGGKFRDYMAVLFGAGAVVSTASMVPWLLSGHTPGDVMVTDWITFMGKPLKMGVLVDPMTIIIVNVVAFISLMIIIYSTGYMHGDPHMTRFWFFFLYFLGSMLLLVVSDNLIQTMIGWEGVGICSYGLIGYYYRDNKERWLGGPPPTKMYSPSECGMKAFVVTGVGDVFLLGAIFIIFNFAGTVNYVELIQTAPEWLAEMSHYPGLIALTALLFLGGPIGKSAQFPLHEWLPEAMAGPTSVSALIHAATMVKAGVYLVARMSPVFYIGAWFLHLQEAQVYFIAIAIVGGFTCFLAASQALVSVELKKILAYSTVSQIGYMMLGLGLSGLSEEAYITGLTAGIFHLASHALFKGALFLCAGCVIHAVESIYTFNMGGLKKHMPKTYILMLLATLSLSGIPPFSGFWSKDAVFLSALTAGTPLAMVLLVVGVISAAMTFAYSLRYISNTFLGEESEFIHELEHHGHHVHEAPTVMWAPIAILVALFSIIGLLGLAGLANPGLSPEVFIEEAIHHSIEHILPTEVAEQLSMAHVSGQTKLVGAGLSAVALAIGGFLGWNFFWKKTWDSWAWVQADGLRKSIHTFLWNRWYLNALYYLVFVDGFILLGRGLHSTLEKLVFDKITPVVSGATISLGVTLHKNVEQDVIDKGLNEGIPHAAISLWDHARKLQTGVLSYNIAYIGFILLVLILLFVFVIGGGM